MWAAQADRLRGKLISLSISHIQLFYEQPFELPLLPYSFLGFSLWLQKKMQTEDF